MENVRNEEPNKYEKWEIVKVVDDTKSFNNLVGFITSMYQHEKSGIWEYSIYLYEYESIKECFESKIESTGEFIPKKEQEERTSIISRRPKFDFNEIIEITNHEDDRYDEFIGRKGRISGTAQNYNTGSWGYSLDIEGEDVIVDGFETKGECKESV